MSKEGKIRRAGEMTVAERRSRGTLQSFRDLQVWNKAMELAAEVYRLTQRFPREEAFGLTSQVRRSAISIASNIAEGHGRMNRREFKHFLLIARGSHSELQTQLELARTFGYPDPDSLDRAEQLSSELDRMLFALISKLNSS